MELSLEPVKAEETGYPIYQESPAVFPHSIELHIGSASVLVANDVDTVLLAQTIQMLHGGPSC